MSNALYRVLIVSLLFASDMTNHELIIDSSDKKLNEVNRRHR